MSLEYASAPAPSYPREALRAGITGTVLLEVLVGVDGSPLKVTIHQSSGNRELDRAAQQQVQKHWRFRPASRDGAPVQAIAGRLFLSPGTVRNYLSSAIGKTGTATRVEAAKTAQDRGWL